MASFLEKLFRGRVVVLEMALQSSSSQQSQIDWDFLANSCKKRKTGYSSEEKILQRQPWKHKAASFSLETNKAKDQNRDSAEPQRAHIPLTCPFIQEQKDMYHESKDNNSETNKVNLPCFMPWIINTSDLALVAHRIRYI